MRQPVLVTPTTAEPVTLGECKTQANIFHSDDDGYISGVLIPAAVQSVESWCNRQLMPATWRLDLDGFPTNSTEPIQIPRPPLTSVSSITYTDTAGTSQTWSTASYVVTVGGEGEFGKVEPAYGEIYPVARDAPNTVSITYVAGFTAAAAVPAITKLAIRTLVAHWYESREPIVVGTIVNGLPWHIENMLMQGPAGRMATWC